MELNPEGLYTIKQIRNWNLLPFSRGTMHKLIRDKDLKAEKLRISDNREVYVVTGAELERFKKERTS